MSRPAGEVPFGWRVVSGFGGAERIAGRSAAPRDLEELQAVLQRARSEGLHVALRGSGYSYGDAAYLPQGVTVDLRGLSRIHGTSDEGVVDAESGLTLGGLWQHAVTRGYWPAVVPGTQAPTLGAGVAVDLHGKNHWKVGTFGDHVESLTLLTADGRLRECSREQDSELFHHVIGGLGLLGVVVRMKVRLAKVYSGRIKVQTHGAPSLQALMSRFREALPGADAAVAWVDATARGDALGRGILEVAHEPGPGEDPLGSTSLAPEYLRLPERLAGVPRKFLWPAMQLALRKETVGLFNRARYNAGRLKRKEQFVPRPLYNFRLDAIPEWRRAYGSDGFLQFQAFVPDAAAESTFRQVLSTTHEHGMPGFLAVLKRHRPSHYALAYSLDGWSLALDFPAPRARREELMAMLRILTDQVLDAGGRFYFAKDSILGPEEVEKAWGREALEEFFAFKRQLDPENLFQTSLSHRAFGPWMRG